VMGAARTSETLVNFSQTTRCYNPEDSHLEAMVVCMVGYGRVHIWRESRVRQWVCVCAFGRNQASVAVKMFSHLMYFIKKFYRCTFNVICKDNAAIKMYYCLTQKNIIPINFDESYTMLVD
jgi:hypothetical protein